MNKTRRALFFDTCLVTAVEVTLFMLLAQWFHPALFAPELVYALATLCAIVLLVIALTTPQ